MTSVVLRFFAGLLLAVLLIEAADAACQQRNLQGRWSAYFQVATQNDAGYCTFAITPLGKMVDAACVMDGAQKPLRGQLTTDASCFVEGDFRMGDKTYTLTHATLREGFVAGTGEFYRFTVQMVRRP